MSTHRVEVVRLGPIEKHPNADTLGIVQVWGYTAMVRLGEWNEGDLAAYIEPDYVVPETEQFAFLSDRRIRAKRLRGLWSQGLVVRPPDDASEGECVMDRLGIVRYEPRVKFNRFGGVKGENLYAESPHDSLRSIPKYDLENLRRYVECFTPGEHVYVTEKIHGTNARYAFRDGRMWVGARSHWRKQPESEPGDWWWSALAQNPWIEEWCRANEDRTLFGEVFGDVQDLTYGAKPGQLMFRAFDVMERDMKFVRPADLLCLVGEERCAPMLFAGGFDFAALCEMSRNDSTIAKHVSEGVVVKPETDRFDRRVGRLALKLVSDRYLERAK